MTDYERLRRLLIARHPLVTIQTTDESLVLDGLAAAVSKEKRSSWTWSAVKGLVRGVAGTIPEQDKTEHPSAALYHMLQSVNHKGVLILLDVLDFLPDPKLVRLLRELVAAYETEGGTVVLVGAMDDLPPPLSDQAIPFEPALPNDQEIEALVKHEAKQANRERKAKIQVSRRALNVMIRNLRGLRLSQAKRVLAESIADDMALTDEDVNTILSAKRRMLHADGVLDYVETPLNLDSIAGMRRLKGWLNDRADAFTTEAEAFGLHPPRGVLLLGVPGAGKSLCAKAVAASWQRPLLRLDPSSLYDRYIGESERRLRSALDQAEAMSPLVLWIDEIEKGFASASARSSDGGLSQRMFGTLLSWMQEHTAPVFIVATANNIEALPPELLRKGRFDEVFFVDLPSANVRKAIFRIHLKKRGLDPKVFDLARLASASDQYTGAEIETAIEAALFAGFPSRTPPDTQVIEKTLQGSPPLSVTMHEAMVGLRNWAKSRTVPAD